MIRPVLVLMILLVPVAATTEKPAPTHGGHCFKYGPNTIVNTKNSDRALSEAEAAGVERFQCPKR